MPATLVNHIGGREILIHLHIAQQPGARVATFEQIVAQDPVFGKAVFERVLECLDVINPLADKGSLAKDVLVNIGDRARVGIKPRLATPELRIARSIAAREIHHHARLQYAIASGNPGGGFVAARAV